LIVEAFEPPGSELPFREFRSARTKLLLPAIRQRVLIEKKCMAVERPVRTYV
jgi:hypothetical protein